MLSIAPISPQAPVRVSLSTGSLLIVMHSGKPHVVVRPAVESLGLDYSTQLRKLKTRSWACVVQQPMQIPGDDQIRSVAVVPVRTFLMLLATINEHRVAEHARPALVAFQNETADAIEAYWTQGVAVRPRPWQINRPRGMTVSDFRVTFFGDVAPRQLDRHLYDRGYLIDQRNTRINSHGELRDGYKHRHPTAKGSRWFQLPEDRYVDGNGHERGGAVIRPDRVHELVDQLISEGLEHNATISRAPSRLALTESTEVVDGYRITMRRGA
ncbi:phage antirepressor N-terminal domain-containing protein [Streptomyces sp. NPDC002690]